MVNTSVQLEDEITQRVPAIAVDNIHKYYGQLHVLRGANISLYRGEILALVGDNGAGKSTLMNILSGALPYDEGVVKISGKNISDLDVQKAHDHGVSTVYQNLALAPDLTVSDMLFLGQEITKPGILGRLGFLDRSAMREKSKKLLSDVGIALPNTEALLSNLSGGQRQALAIAKAMSTAETAILMDEPTAALGPRQTKIIYDAMKNAASQGIGVLVISHDIPQMLNIADRMAIMRHGVVIAELESAKTDLNTVINLMLGNTSPNE